MPKYKIVLSQEYSYSKTSEFEIESNLSEEEVVDMVEEYASNISQLGRLGDNVGKDIKGYVDGSYEPWESDHEGDSEVNPEVELLED
jgi:hypothetical protein